MMTDMFCEMCVTVISLSVENGFVDLRSHLDRNMSAQLDENVELKVEIDAYPKPSVHWTKDGGVIHGENTRQTHETR